MTKYQISDLLDELKSDEAYTRNDAIKKIIKGKINDEKIIVALMDIIEHDQSTAVRNFAHSTLNTLLHSAPNDYSNPDLAKAAQRAIALHTPQSTDVVVGEKEQDNVIVVKYWSLIGLLAGIAPALVFAVIAREWIFGLGGAFCFGSLGIPFTLVGAYIGRRSNKTAWIGAVLGMALGIGLLIALLSTCFFCQ